jgi:ABC-type nitrate/sulfonate/bicarbonate transport system ATPase subunit
VASEGAVTVSDREILRFEKVSRVFRTPARGELRALDALELACPRGALTCVVGPSGCGKTTLLRLAAGLDHPTGGRVLFEGRPVRNSPEGVGLVSQEGTLLPWRRVLENVWLGLEVRGVGRRERMRRARRALARVGLPGQVARSYPHELSGGMRQRAALAGVLCSEPRVLLMDEPFASVDEPTRERLQADLAGLWAADRRTILFVTHSVEEAVFLADRVVVMTFGRIVADMPVDLPRPRDRLSQAFVQALLGVRRALANHGSDDLSSDELSARRDDG